MKNIIFYYLFFVLQFILCFSLTLNDLEKTFKFEKCIQGSLTSVDQTVGIATSNSKLVQGSQSSGITLEELYLFNISKVQEKSSMSQIHELAQYHDLEYEYKLLSEEGPAHNKLFKVQLMLGGEYHEGEATTIKKAQQYAASIALQNTKYEVKPANIDEVTINSLTPTVKLNNIAAKLGLSVKYTVMDTVEGKMFTYKNVDVKQGHTYLEKLNHSIYHSAEKHADVEGASRTRGPYNVKVLVDTMEFIGYGHEVQVARHDAAQKAIDYMKHKAVYKQNACTTEGSEDECRKAKENIKSPVSKIYEAAQKHKLEVEFQIISEIGPPHKKVFTTRCVLGDFTTEGVGSSKKESKRLAAEKMLVNLSLLPQNVDDTNEIVNALKPKKKKKKKKKLARVYEEIDSPVDSWNIFGSSDGGDKHEQDFHNDATDTKKSDGGSFKHKKQHFISSQDAKSALLNIGGYLGFEINFHDLGRKDDESFTLVSLGVQPPYLCFGKAMNEELSSIKATLESIKLLLRNGITNKLYKQLKDEQYVSFLVEDLNRHLSQDSLNQDASEIKGV